MSKKRRQILQKATTREKERIYLTNVEKSFLGLGQKEERSYAVLKYYRPDFECFSVWDSAELKAFSNFLMKLKFAEWKDIYATAGKAGTKKGFGYTPHKDRNRLPDDPGLSDISPDITFFELRVTQKARVHGFRVKSAFFLVWLDRNHRIYPG